MKSCQMIKNMPIKAVKVRMTAFLSLIRNLNFKRHIYIKKK